MGSYKSISGGNKWTSLGSTTKVNAVDLKKPAICTVLWFRWHLVVANKSGVALDSFP